MNGIVQYVAFCDWLFSLSIMFLRFLYDAGYSSTSFLLLSEITLNNIPLYSIMHLYIYQFSSVAQSCPTLCDPMDCSTPRFSVHHQLPELSQTHVQQVGDTIQPSDPLSSPSPPAFDLSQHQSLFQGVGSSHQVAKVLEHQLQNKTFQ